MTEFKFTVDSKSLQKLRKRLGDVNVKAEAVKAMQKTMLELQSEAGKYPGYPPGHVYRRTGDLGRKWTTKVETFGDNVVGTIGSDATSPAGKHYGPWVKGPKKQRPVFKLIGWKTLEQDFEEKKSKILGFFDAALKGIARKF